MKRPSFQFYPGDHQRDNALRACSIPARGLWIEVLCIAHQATPYGYLLLNGQAVTSHVLAGMIGGAGTTARSVEKWLAELKAAGVCSVDANGRIFSRRMVRDEHVREARAMGGQAGAEHGIKGAEFGKKGGRPRNGTGDIKPPLNPPPSSSSSSSSSSSRNSKAMSGSSPDALPPKSKNGHDHARMQKLRADAVEVLQFLNKKTGRAYRPAPANLGLIVQRMRDGASTDDLRAVIAMKVREWKGNEKMAQYLRPATLFDRTKFEQYVGELVQTAAAP